MPESSEAYKDTEEFKKITELEKKMRDPYYLSDLHEKMRRGDILTPEEINENAKHEISELQDWKPEQLLKKEGELNLNSILLAHATNYVPKFENGNLVVDSVGNADPFRKRHEKRKDNYKDWAGSRDFRFTVHFGVVGSPASHREANEKGEFDYNALSKRKVVVIMNTEKAFEDEKNFPCDLQMQDTFFFDKVSLPEGSIVILTPEKAKELKISANGMNKYQILIKENPGNAYMELINGKFRDFSKNTDEIYNSSNLVSDTDRTGEIGVGKNDEYHYNSIYNDIESFSTILPIPNKEFSNELNDKDFLEKYEKNQTGYKINSPEKYYLLSLISETESLFVNKLDTLEKILNKSKLNEGSEEYKDKLKFKIIEKIREPISYQLKKLDELMEKWKDIDLEDTVVDLKDDSTEVKANNYRFKYIENIQQMKKNIEEVLNNAEITILFPDFNLILNKINLFLKTNQSIVENIKIADKRIQERWKTAS
jgi:hypothetical protein